MHIPPYEAGDKRSHLPVRPRKLLLHRREHLQTDGRTAARTGSRWCRCASTSRTDSRRSRPRSRAAGGPTRSAVAMKRSTNARCGARSGADADVVGSGDAHAAPTPPSRTPWSPSWPTKPGSTSTPLAMRRSAIPTPRRLPPRSAGRLEDGIGADRRARGARGRVGRPGAPDGTALLPLRERGDHTGRPGRRLAHVDVGPEPRSVGLHAARRAPRVRGARLAEGAVRPPAEWGGILTTGATMANFTALACA